MEEAAFAGAPPCIWHYFRLKMCKGLPRGKIFLAKACPYSKPRSNMNFVKSILLLAFFLVSAVGHTQQGTDRHPIFNDASKAIAAGSAKGLVAHFNKTVSLNFDGETNIYGKAQSEFVLKAFFEKYPILKFEYSHLGKSPEGLRYAIGKYTYEGGTFLVYIMIKDADGVSTIDTLNFHEEDD
jgi:hypothetical protein